MAESNGKSDREAELDRKIAEIRRRNEDLIKRKQEVDNDRYEASKVTGGAVSLSGSGPTGRDNSQVPATNVRERLGKGRAQGSERGLTAANSHPDSQQQNKPERQNDTNWRQERETVDKERLQRTKDGGGKWKREWDSAKSNSNTQQPQRASANGGKDRQVRGPSNNTSNSPAANQKANRPANQQSERSPRQDSVPEDPRHAHLQRTIVADGDQIIISVANVEKSGVNSPASKSIKSRLGPRVEPSQPTAGTKAKPERLKQNQKRVEQSIKLHVLPLNTDQKVIPTEKQQPNTDVSSKTISEPDAVVDDTEQWEDVEGNDEESNNDDNQSPDKTDELVDDDIEPDALGTRKIRTDTFDRIQQDMIDKMNENVDAVEALMDESDEDIDAFLAGNKLMFSRRFDREQRSENDVVECVGDMVRRVSLD